MSLCQPLLLPLYVAQLRLPALEHLNLLLLVIAPPGWAVLVVVVGIAALPRQRLHRLGVL